ncbi:MAG: hypothetical protein KDD10_17575 [Phaeodactylibacter sp.]|nr:hypothetical protein [Phaeodactylibacter sp.]MCB9292240.1 hypothetical protein [Lewinellaceae bacterium]
MYTDYLSLIVEVSVTVYVFLLGLPILVNQIFLPEDLRRMSRKNYAANLINQLLVLTVLLLLIILTAYPRTLFWLIPFPPEQIPGRELLITLLFFLMLFSTLAFLYIHLIRSQGYRAKVVHIIKKKLLDSYRKTGKLDRAYLDDIEYLGIYSKGGAETRIVIQALEEILQNLKVDTTPGKNDDNLIQLVEILCNSVANSTEPGSRSNMIEVLAAYKDILMSLKMQSTPDNPLIYGNETRKVKDCTFKIALASLKKDYSDMMPRVLNVLSLIPGSSDKLFDIGLLALEKKQFQVATNVLSEMMDRDNQDAVTMNNYIGLIARFSFSGQAARQCARRSLERNGVAMSGKMLKEAYGYHYNLCNFETAGLIAQLDAAGSSGA